MIWHFLFVPFNCLVKRIFNPLKKERWKIKLIVKYIKESIKLTLLGALQKNHSVHIHKLTLYFGQLFYHLTTWTPRCNFKNQLSIYWLIPETVNKVYQYNRHILRIKANFPNSNLQFALKKKSNYKKFAI